MAEQTITVRVEAPSAEAFAEAYARHLGPGSVFVPAEEQPALGSRVALTLLEEDGAELLRVHGRVGWRYPREAAPPGRKVGFGLELSASPRGHDEVLAAMRTAPWPAFARPGSRIPPVGFLRGEVEGPTAAPAPDTRPLPKPLVVELDDERPELAAAAWMVRPGGERGDRLVHLERFAWPPSGTSRPPSPLIFEEPAPEPSPTPSDEVPPEMSTAETASFEEDVTDPGRLSRFVKAAIETTAQAPGPSEAALPSSGPGANVGDRAQMDESLETMEDFEPLRVESEESEPSDEAGLAVLGSEDDEPDDRTEELPAPPARSTSDEEPVTEDALTAPTLSPVDDTEDASLDEAPPAADDASLEGDDGHEDEDKTAEHPAPPRPGGEQHEEEPSRLLTQPVSHAPALESDLLLALPGRPIEVAFAQGTPLPQRAHHEVGTGGERHVEVGVYEARGSQRELLGIARFEAETEGAVFDVEIRVEPEGRVWVGADLPEAPSFVFRRAAAGPAAERPRPRPPKTEPGGEEAGLLGRLKKRILGP